MNRLFTSLAASAAERTAAVLLSGMGDDGVEGMLELRRRGAVTVGQAAESCAVFGMPRVAVERGATDLLLDAEQIGEYLCRLMGCHR